MRIEKDFQVLSGGPRLKTRLLNSQVTRLYMLVASPNLQIVDFSEEILAAAQKLFGAWVSFDVQYLRLVGIATRMLEASGHRAGVPHYLNCKSFDLLQNVMYFGSLCDEQSPLLWCLVSFDDVEKLKLLTSLSSAVNLSGLSQGTDVGRETGRTIPAMRRLL